MVSLRGWLIMFAAFYVITIVHELAHLWEARRMGIPMKSMLIGIPPLIKIKVGSFPIRLGPLPVAGAVVAIAQPGVCG